MRWEIDIGESFWLASLFYLGEWRELVRQAQVVLHDAIERGDVVAQIGARTGLSNLAWLLAGNADEARAQLAAAEAVLPSGFHMPHLLATQAGCAIELYGSNPRAASERLEQAWPAIDRSGLLRIQHLRVELAVLRAQIALADTSRPIEERAKVLRSVSDDLLKEGAEWAAGIGQLLRAAAHVLRGDRDAAGMTLLAAEDHLQAVDMRGWLQVARLRRGTLEGGAGGEARCQAARDFLADLGAANPDAIAALLVAWPS